MGALMPRSVSHLSFARSTESDGMPASQFVVSVGHRALTGTVNDFKMPMVFLPSLINDMCIFQSYVNVQF